jgi:hypothetical protein
MVHQQIYQTNILNIEGESGEMWTMSVSIYACIMIVVHNKLAIYSKTFNAWTLASYVIFSYGPYFLYMIATDDLHEGKQEYFTFYRLFGGSP